ncbi:MAG TPA: sigma-70 family RNA polymerase sigma factor [Chitinispirillaceae bacterium]|nr:sigma-70 family RNA polymerase sigma factor [Chitinispirillaceae bacterium]
MDTTNKYIDDEEMRRISLAAQGDKQAFSELFNQYRVMIYRIVIRFLGVSEDADDAVQQVFIELYKSLPGYMGNSKFTTWLYRIAVNVSIQYIRKRKRGSDFEIFNPEFHVDTTQNSSSSVEQKELQKQIAAALEGIHERKRSVLVLHDMEGLTMEEISEITGLPLGTVKSRLFHAREELRNKLKKQLG